MVPYIAIEVFEKFYFFAGGVINCRVYLDTSTEVVIKSQGINFTCMDY